MTAQSWRRLILVSQRNLRISRSRRRLRRGCGGRAEEFRSDNTAQDRRSKGCRAVGAGALDQLIELDLAFHSELYRASGNHVVLNVMQTQWDHVRRVMMMTLISQSYRKRVWSEHAAIVDAIVRRQVSRARALATAQTRKARAFLTTSLRERGRKRHRES